MNKLWQDEIFIIIERKINQKSGRYWWCFTTYISERNSILTKQLLLNNEQPKALLDEICENADGDDDTWINILAN